MKKGKGYPEDLKAHHDPVKAGHVKKEWPAHTDKNYLIEDAYGKQASPSESEGTDIHAIGSHEYGAGFFSGKDKAKSPSQKKRIDKAPK